MTTPKALPNYLRALGLIDGLRLFSRSLRTGPRREGVSERFRVRSLGVDVHLRPTRADHATFFQCIVKRQYDIRGFPQFADLQRLYERQCQEGLTPLIIDCGGNIGVSALWFATQFPRARIVVVEPDDQNLRMLRLNVEAFGDRIRIVEGAVWNRPTRLRITNPEAGSAAFQVQEVDGSCAEGLRAYAMDELCEIGGNAQPLMVKLDVEGAQGPIFSANTAWTQRAAMISLELDDWLYPWAGTSRPFFRCLAPLEYDYLLCGESIFCFNAAVLHSG